MYTYGIAWHKSHRSKVRQVPWMRQWWRTNFPIQQHHWITNIEEEEEANEKEKEDDDKEKHTETGYMDSFLY